MIVFPVANQYHNINAIFAPNFPVIRDCDYTQNLSTICPEMMSTWAIHR